MPGEPLGQASLPAEIPISATDFCCRRPRGRSQDKGVVRWRRHPREMPLPCLFRPNKQGKAAIPNHPHHCTELRSCPTKLRSHLSHPQAARPSGLPVPIRPRPSPSCPALPNSQQLPVAPAPPQDPCHLPDKPAAHPSERQTCLGVFICGQRAGKGGIFPRGGSAGQGAFPCS